MFNFKVENGGATEKPMPATENSKEVCTPAAVDPGECGTGDAPIVGDGVNGEKTEAKSAVAVAAPIADGNSFSPSVCFLLRFSCFTRM